MIGSSSIDLLGVANGPFSIEAFLTLQELHFGSRRFGITPLEWLSLLALGFETFPKPVQEFVDEFSSVFIALERAIEQGDFEVLPDEEV